MAFTVTLVYPHTFWYRWRNRLTLWRTRPLYTLKARAALVTVTLTPAAGQVSPTNTSPINFTATFSAPVTGFTNSDVQQWNLTAPGKYTTVTTGGPTVFNIAVSGMTPGVGGGNVGIIIGAGVAIDAAGNMNSASPPANVTYNG